MRQIIKKKAILNDNTLCEQYLSAEYVNFRQRIKT